MKTLTAFLVATIGLHTSNNIVMLISLVLFFLLIFKSLKNEKI